MPFTEDPVAGAAAANARRRQQVQVTAANIAERMRPDSRFLLAGDMNDPPDSPDLQPILAGIPLVNGLADAVEDRPAPVDDPPAPAVPWTHRSKPSGQPAQYELFDHIWLSPALAGRLIAAGIGR